MKHTARLSITIILLVFSISLWAEYYDAVDELSGSALYEALQDLISTNTYSNYDGAKVFLFQELDKVGNTVTCVYTGEVYTISSTYSGQNSPNTEHTYAQSWFTPATNVKKSDLHHLFITTMNVNSARGNLPFGDVASTANSTVYYTHTPWQSYRGFNNWQNSVFQVNPFFKGNIARAILYFHTRYGDSIVQGGENMLNTMIAWHYADPPDSAEITRNDMLHSFQGNRNPFVDRPEFVNRIWNPSSTADVYQQNVPDLRIDNIFPNPFKDQLTVAIDAKASEIIIARIYNIKGQLVHSHQFHSSNKSFTWNAKDSSGKEAPAGIYFIRISSSDASAAAKVLLVK